MSRHNASTIHGFGVIDRASANEEHATEQFALRFAVLFAISLHVGLFLLRWADPLPFIRTEMSPRPRPFQIVEFAPKPLTPVAPQPEMTGTRVLIPGPPDIAPEPIQVIQALPPSPHFTANEIELAIPDAPPLPQLDTVLEVGGEVAAPVKIFGSQPGYTEIARRTRIEGVVELALVIDRAGDVRDLQVIRSLSMGLAESAVEAVRDWRFQPATLLDGTPVPVRYQLLIHFTLN